MAEAVNKNNKELHLIAAVNKARDNKARDNKARDNKVRAKRVNRDSKVRKVEKVEFPQAGILPLRKKMKAVATCPSPPLAELLL